ncbi:MAG: M48 family metalloprotease [Lewinellaceae bacterium]|nr:M48 family metalloprotease [Lewinellaceae bacterium]
MYCGLLAGLENEDQLAFVLCHEIAHYLLEHATKGLVREIATFHDKAFKAKVKAANKQEFNRNEQLANIYKNVLFKSRYHRRDLESGSWIRWPIACF